MIETVNRIVKFLLSSLVPDFADLVRTTGSRLSEIRNNLYLGSLPRVDSLGLLKKTGITHVVSCLDESSRPKVDFLADNFIHLFLKVHDGIYEDILSSLDAFFNFTHRFLSQSTDEKLLVHCEAGVSRSAAFMIALIMMREKRSFLESFRLVKKKRFDVLPNIGFASQLQQLENRLAGNISGETSSSLAVYLKEYCGFPADSDVIQASLRENSCDAVKAALSVFGGEIPRVIKGVKK